MLSAGHVELVAHSYIAAQLGHTIATLLKTYAHLFDWRKYTDQARATTEAVVAAVEAALHGTLVVPEAAEAWDESAR